MEAVFVFSGVAATGPLRSILSSVPHGRIVAVAALGLSQNHSSCHYASKRTHVTDFRTAPHRRFFPDETTDFLPGSRDRALRHKAGGKFQPGRADFPCDCLKSVCLHGFSGIKKPDRQQIKGIRYRSGFGAGGGGRTRTSLRTRDFESRASANFTTPAKIKKVPERGTCWWG